MAGHLAAAQAARGAAQRAAVQLKQENTALAAAHQVRPQPPTSRRPVHRSKHRLCDAAYMALALRVKVQA